VTQNVEPPKANSELLSGRSLARSAWWSLLSQALPALVGLVTIPTIIRGLGIERFGVLTLAWMVIGYFSLFDLGLGRAVTKFAAEHMVSPRSDGNRLVWTAWYLMLGIGLLGALLLAGITPWLVHTAIKISLSLQPETLLAFYLLALSVPIVVLTTGFRGLLEADQQFRLTSLVRIPTGILTFVIPLLILPFSQNLAVIVLGLVILRAIGAVIYFVMSLTVPGVQPHPEPFHKESARKLLRFGAWMTVSNIISPLMVGIDRFFVGAFLSVAAVAYYATPFEAVTKLLLVPTALAAVLFPAFSSASMINRDRLMQLFRSGYWILFVTMYPIAFVIITFAPDLLRLWLGDAFALQSSGVLRWLSVGVLTNSLASVPFALLQGLGRSDTTAKIHAVEAPFYVLLMIGLIRQYGITGAALAWAVRTTVDMAVLFLFAERHLGTRVSQWAPLAAPFVAFLPMLGLGLLIPSLVPKAVLTLGLVVCFSVVAWRWIRHNRNPTASG
jgi:O-antigen/teichoic acid export membrane protein